MYIAKVREQFNYGDEETLYYSEEWDGIYDWLKENYPDFEEGEDDTYRDKDGDITIQIVSAYPCDGRAD